MFIWALRPNTGRVLLLWSFLFLHVLWCTGTSPYWLERATMSILSKLYIHDVTWSLGAHVVNWAPSHLSFWNTYKYVPIYTETRSENKQKLLASCLWLGIHLRYFGHDEPRPWGNTGYSWVTCILSGKCLIFKLWASDPISVRFRLLLCKNGYNTCPICFTGLWWDFRWIMHVKKLITMFTELYTG